MISAPEIISLIDYEPTFADNDKARCIFECRDADAMANLPTKDEWLTRYTNGTKIRLAPFSVAVNMGDGTKLFFNGEEWVDMA